jgi:cell wall-associated NlpC family hydrolase
MLAGLGASSASQAAPTANAPSKAGLDAARAKLAALNHQAEVLAEQYNAAKIKVDQIDQQLTQAQSQADQANSEADTANQQLATRTAAAYEGGFTSELNVLLSAGNFNDFSARLEFLDQLAAKDSNIATRAQVAGQQAQWAAQSFAAAKAQQQKAADQLAQKKAALDKAASAAQAQVAQMQQQYKDAMAAARRAAAQAAAQRAAAAAGGGTGTGGTGTTTGGGGGGFNPPPQSSGAGVAVAAAQSAIGSKYVWGAAGPTSFDCSGLTMWAWGKAGVSLPHNAAAQYGSLPHVDKSQLQPGDLLFFYSPISHVAIYVGGGSEIDASNPQTGVTEHGVYWGSYVGAARPG